MQRSKLRKAIAALPPGLPDKGMKVQSAGGSTRRMPGLDDALKLVTNDRTRQRIESRYRREKGA